MLHLTHIHILPEIRVPRESISSPLLVHINRYTHIRYYLNIKYTQYTVY